MIYSGSVFGLRWHDLQLHMLNFLIKITEEHEAESAFLKNKNFVFVSRACLSSARLLKCSRFFFVGPSL